MGPVCNVSDATLTVPYVNHGVRATVIKCEASLVQVKELCWARGVDSKHLKPSPTQDGNKVLLPLICDYVSKLILHRIAILPSVWSCSECYE
jgi:hypothetical protein